MQTHKQRRRGARRSALVNALALAVAASACGGGSHGGGRGASNDTTTTAQHTVSDAVTTLGGRHIAGRPDVRYEVGPVELTGKAVTRARVSFQQGGDGWGVDLTLNAKGLAAFNAMAATQYGQPAPANQVAIVLDGVVQSAPAFQTSHFDNPGVRISGSYTRQEAQNLASTTIERPGSLDFRPVLSETPSPGTPQM